MLFVILSCFDWSSGNFDRECSTELRQCLNPIQTELFRAPQNWGGIFSSPSISSSSNRIILKFCMEVTFDKILTHAKIWNEKFGMNDVSILIIDLCHCHLVNTI